MQRGKKTLILTHRERLEERFTDTDSLMDKLDELANHTQVAGDIIDLSTYPQLNEIYNKSDEHPDDAQYANLVSASIKALLTTILGIASLPQLWGDCDWLGELGVGRGCGDGYAARLSRRRGDARLVADFGPL